MSLQVLHRRWRPTLWPTLVTVPAVLLMLGLGVWQVERLSWKTALLRHIGEQMTAPALPLPAAVADPVAFDYRRVSITGRFLHDREMYLAARSLRDNVGYQVLTPMVRDGGEAVLVNRGWIPLDKRDPSTRAAGQTGGVVTVEGVARMPRGRNWFQPDNEPDRGFWFWIDPPAMAGYAGVPRLAPVVVEAGSQPNPGGLPIGGQTRVTIPNDHLQYAITWFSLAIALVVVYVVYHWRRAASPSVTPQV
jgi:surfeit locus 1 family protein